LAAAGARPEAGWKVDGKDLLAVWQGKAKAPQRTLFWEWRVEGYQQVAAMRGDWKMVITGTNPPELFDVKTDPAERRSRAAEQPALVAQLRKELTAWLATETEASKEGRAPVKKKK
jgi:arylsulfatase A-like enzyme